MTDEVKITDDGDFVNDEGQSVPHMIGRLFTDTWCFGILLADGTKIAVRGLAGEMCSFGGESWLDVSLMDREEASALWGDECIAATCDRNVASIRTSHIIAVFELCTS